MVSFAFMLGAGWTSGSDIRPASVFWAACLEVEQFSLVLAILLESKGKAGPGRGIRFSRVHVPVHRPESGNHLEAEFLIPAFFHPHISRSDLANKDGPNAIEDVASPH